jgi:crotonobetainyl-CoA:carnitine CoA-transferase CaiB-like acyl-CoA transferase
MGSAVRRRRALLGRARTVEDMFDNEQVLAEDMVATFAHPTLGTYRGFTRPVQFGRTPGPEPFAAPTLGQHTDAVLAARKAR